MIARGFELFMSFIDLSRVEDTPIEIEYDNSGGCMSNESSKKIFPVKKQLERTVNFKIKRDLQVLIKTKIESLPKSGS